MCSSPTAGVLYLFRERNAAQELVRLPLSGEQDQEPLVLTSGLPMLSHTRCDVSADGERLLYTRTSGHANIWRLDLRGATPAATALTRGTSVLALSKSLTRWAVDCRDAGQNVRTSNREDSSRWR